MPSQTEVIGGVASIYVPDDTNAIALGYTGIRVYWATSETASATLATTLTLVAAQHDYTYNKTDALATDWFEWCKYGVTPGEGPRSERLPIGPPQVTRKQIRQGVGARLNLVDVHSMASVSTAAIGIISALIDPDASPHVIANRIARIVGGTASGQTRRLRAGATGYTVADGTITLNRATSPAWIAADEVELWKAKGDTDPSVQIDDAMNRARYGMWWEETWYFSGEANVTEFWLPAYMRDEHIKAVHAARGTYPSQPSWGPLNYYEVTMQGGNPLLSFAPSMTSSDVLRIVHNRMGDRMDGDTDYWSVPLEWAIAETALEFLKANVVPRGGKEDVSDAMTALKMMASEVSDFRRSQLPSVAARVRLAR